MAILPIVRKVWRHGVVLALNFVVTLALFPGVTTLIESSDPSMISTDWLLIVLFVRGVRGGARRVAACDARARADYLHGWRLGRAFPSQVEGCARRSIDVGA